jgi:tetratricopeptide (TPR) repeat protein
VNGKPGLRSIAVHCRQTNPELHYRPQHGMGAGQSRGGAGRRFPTGENLMLRVSVSARRKARKGLVSTAVAAAVLAVGAVSGGVATPAYAQKEKGPNYTKAFVDAYEPVQNLFNSTTDATGLEPVRPLVPAMVAAVANDDDRFAGGAMLIQIGLRLKDSNYQRDGIMLQLASGKVAPEQQPLFNYYAGSFSRDEGKYAQARDYLQKAYDLGYKDSPDLEWMLVESYFKQNQYAEGFAAFDKMVAERGKAIPEITYRRMIQTVLDQNLTDQLVKRSADLIRAYPSEKSWNTVLRVVVDSFDFTADESIDLYRLMRLTHSMTEARSYVEYIEAVDVNRRSNEILPVIREGIDNGLLKADDAFVKEALDAATARAPEDRSAADEDAALARAATDAVSARATADNYYTLENFAAAEEFYKLALQRAPDDGDRLNMRIGISQARQGKTAEARASFEAVKGKRAQIAALWMAWLDTQATG